MIFRKECVKALFKGVGEACVIYLVFGILMGIILLVGWLLSLIHITSVVAWWIIVIISLVLLSTPFYFSIYENLKKAGCLIKKESDYED